LSCVSGFDPLVGVANAAADVNLCWIGFPLEWIAHGYWSAENLSCVSGFHLSVGITDSAADVNVYIMDLLLSPELGFLCYTWIYDLYPKAFYDFVYGCCYVVMYVVKCYTVTHMLLYTIYIYNYNFAVCWFIKKKYFYWSKT